MFKAIKNINPVQTLPTTTTFAISKGVPVRLAAGVVTVCATNICDVFGIAHETIASGNSGFIKVLPAQGPNGMTLWESQTTAAAADNGKTYLLVMATNAASIGAADTNEGAFYIVTCDATTAYGYLTGSAFSGVLSVLS